MKNHAQGNFADQLSVHVCGRTYETVDAKRRRSHRIRTQDVWFAHGRLGRAVGFVGDVTFHALSGERPYLSLLHTLADFAAFSGVGAKTTMGMGRVERRTLRQPLLHKET